MDITGLIINNDLYEFDKDLNQSNPYQTELLTGGVRIDWGNDDVDILTGETWTTEGIYENIGGAFYRWDFQYRLVYISTGGELFTWRNAIIYSTIPLDLKEISCSNAVALYSIFRADVSSNTNTQRTICGQAFFRSISSVLNPETKNHWVSLASGNSDAKYEWRNESSTYISGQDEQQLVGWKVTSDTGQVSQRNQPSQPQISTIPSDCKLTINFADSSSEIMIFSDVCPTVEPYYCFDCPGLIGLINQGIERINNVLQL